MKGLQRPDNRLPGGVEQRLLVSAVVDEKYFIPVAGAKMTTQNGKDTVFGFDLAAQYASQFRKPDKSLQQVGLAIEMADRGDDRVESLV